MDGAWENAAGEPSREEIDRSTGLLVLEFGASWCGHCAALRPHLSRLLRQNPEVKHLVIEDGKGQPLGRSFQVKLWPTLVFLANGEVVHRAVRPSPEEARAGFEVLARAAS